MDAVTDQETPPSRPAVPRAQFLAAARHPQDDHCDLPDPPHPDPLLADRAHPDPLHPDPLHPGPMRPGSMRPGPSGAEPEILGPLEPLDAARLHERLNHIAAHIERLAQHPIHEPAWLRRTAEEPRLPVIVAVLAAIGLQAAVPHSLAFRPWWLLPGLELLILALIVGFRQTTIDRRSKILRVLGIILVAAASLATAFSAGELVRALVHGGSHADGLDSAGLLLRNGGAIWVTNIIVFALWYWEMDRGGPAERACGTVRHPDFLFSQMTMPELVTKDWEPNFFDYLYLSFTNATAFSPTDTLPMSRWAKMVMMFQSAVSLATVALVVARAVNAIQ
jgi:uncharacterized membrane protein